MSIRIAVFSDLNNGNLASLLKGRGYEVVAWVGTARQRCLTWGPPRFWPLLAGAAGSRWVRAPLALLRGRADWWRIARDPGEYEVLRDIGIPRVAAANVNDPAFVGWLASLELDLIVVTEFGQILKPAVFSAPRLGAINCHPSPLPRYAGPDPVFWMIRNGEPQTAITIHMISESIDGGDILARVTLAIGADETAGQLDARLIQKEIEVIVDVVDKIAGGKAHPQPQDRAERSYQSLPRDEDKSVNWHESSEDIMRLLRAVQPDDHMLTSISGRRIAIKDAEPCEAMQNHSVPGEVISNDGHRVLVKTGQGCLCLLDYELVPARKWLSGRSSVGLLHQGAQFNSHVSAQKSLA